MHHCGVQPGTESTVKHGEGYGSTDVPESSGRGAPKTPHTTGIDASESVGYPATNVSVSSETALPDSRRQAYHPFPHISQFPLTWWPFDLLAGLGHKRQAEQGWKARANDGAADGDTGNEDHHVATQSHINGLHPRAKIRRCLMRVSFYYFLRRRRRASTSLDPPRQRSSAHPVSRASRGRLPVGPASAPPSSPAPPLPRLRRTWDTR